MGFSATLLLSHMHETHKEQRPLCLAERSWRAQWDSARLCGPHWEIFAGHAILPRGRCRTAFGALDQRNPGITAFAGSVIVPGFHFLNFWLQLALGEWLLYDFLSLWKIYVLAIAPFPLKQTRYQAMILLSRPALSFKLRLISPGDYAHLKGPRPQSFEPRPLVIKFLGSWL